MKINIISAQVSEKVYESSEILYVIKDRAGNQLSAPNSNDSELWDRVSNMESRGRTGLSVVVYSKKEPSYSTWSEVWDQELVPLMQKSTPSTITRKVKALLDKHRTEPAWRIACEKFLSEEDLDAPDEIMDAFNRSKPSETDIKKVIRDMVSKFRARIGRVSPKELQPELNSLLKNEYSDLKFKGSDIQKILSSCQMLICEGKNLKKTGAICIQESDEELETHEQEFSSAATSINSNKLPAIFRLVKFEPGTINLDYGGGRFDNVADFLEPQGVTNLVYDPYNRSSSHNFKVISQIKANGGADTITCSNVLNVIKEPEARQGVIRNISKLLKSGGTAYFTVYEGTGDGAEGQTKAGYQLNRKLQPM